MQPLHCGYGMERLENPRLRALGRLNPQNPSVLLTGEPGHFL
jgi:hypothetical protein